VRRLRRVLRRRGRLRRGLRGRRRRRRHLRGGGPFRRNWRRDLWLGGICSRDGRRGGRRIGSGGRLHGRRDRRGHGRLWGGRHGVRGLRLCRRGARIRVGGGFGRGGGRLALRRSVLLVR